MSDQVEKVGAYLGIAAFLGLAALALLYFAQARELKRLREWAGRAPERAQDLQTRVVAEAEAAARRVRAEPQAKPAAVPGATPGAKPAAAPAAAGAATAAAVTAGAKPGAPAPAAQPATPGAPAPASDGGGPPAAAPVPAKPGAPAPAAQPATPGAPAPAAQPGSPAPAPAAAGAAAAGAVAGAAAVPAKPAEGAKPAETSAAPGAPAEPGEEEAAKEREPAATNGSPPAPVAPATAAARGAARPIPSDDTGEYTVEEDAIQAPPPLPPPRRPAPAPLRSGAAASRRPAPARAAQPAEAGDGRSTRNTVLAVLAGLLVLAGAAFGATQLLGGEDAPEQPASNEPLPPQNVEPATGGDGGDEAAADPSEIAVHVLNGTTVSGLAAQIADKLKAEGYAAPVTGNNADQQRTQSEVLYADGHRADARALSEVLDVSAVEALDPTTTPAEGADVVVVVGADQAQ